MYMYGYVNICFWLYCNFHSEKTAAKITGIALKEDNRKYKVYKQTQLHSFNFYFTFKLHSHSIRHDQVYDRPKLPELL